MFEKQSIFDILILLLPGLWTTLRLAVVSAAAGMAMGVALAVAFTWGPAPVRWLLNALLAVARGVPLVVQAFAVFFGMPLLGWQPSALVAAGVVLIFFTSMTTMEVVRGGFLAVPKGQLMAARALGMTFWQGLRLVLLPQALRAMLPSLVNQLVLVIKATSIASFIGVADVMLLAKEVVERTQMGFAVMGLVWLLYTAFCLPLTMAARWMERRLGAGRSGASRAALV
jgi:polar amino acid transport system permease protein